MGNYKNIKIKVGERYGKVYGFMDSTLHHMQLRWSTKTFSTVRDAFAG